VEFLRREPTPFVEFALDSIDRFTLIDVGCAGGIDPPWHCFGDKLSGFGFDAMVEEVARLNADPPSDDFRYVAALVTGNPGIAIQHRRNPTPRLSYERTSAMRTGRGFFIDPPQVPPEYLGVNPEVTEDFADCIARQATINPSERDYRNTENKWQETQISDCVVRLDDFCKASGMEDADFVKIDIDGFDWEVLKTLERSMSEWQVLGVCAEVNFFGSDEDDHHTFHNTDRFLRARGFELFHLSMRRYASGALPTRYLLNFPAMTTSGRPLQGDAVYLRDFAWILPEADPRDYSAQKHLKLAALFAMFDLPDLAAEVLIRSRGLVSPIMDVERGLDLLAVQANSPLGYSDHIARFDADDPSFYGALFDPQPESHPVAPDQGQAEDIEPDLPQRSWG
jgi:hypothetical protein